MSSQYTDLLRDSMALGQIAARITQVALVLWIVSLLYRAGEDLAAFALGGLIVLYVVASLSRDLRYDLTPWEPVEWTTVSPGELDAGDYRRALRWTVALKLIWVVGAVFVLAAVFTASLETLGYMLLFGGLLVLPVTLVKHHLNNTKPWYPSVPSRTDQLQSDR